MIPEEAMPKDRDPKVVSILEQVWSGPIGACEKAKECAWKSKACELAYNLGSLLPAKRYLLCHAWLKYRGRPVEV